jgi:hypothetical protein
MVRSSGFEPPRYCYRQPLKLVRLPVPPRPHRGNLRYCSCAAKSRQDAIKSLPCGGSATALQITASPGYLGPAVAAWKTEVPQVAAPALTPGSQVPGQASNTSARMSLLIPHRGQHAQPRPRRRS